MSRYTNTCLPTDRQKSAIISIAFIYLSCNSNKVHCYSKCAVLSTGLYVAESSEISVPGMLFEEFVLDIPDDVEEYENSAIIDGTYINGEVSHLLGEEHRGEKLSAAALEEAAAGGAKPDKHFDMFKETTSANPCQVHYYNLGQIPT